MRKLDEREQRFYMIIELVGELQKALPNWHVVATGGTKKHIYAINMSTPVGNKYNDKSISVFAKNNKISINNVNADEIALRSKDTWYLFKTEDLLPNVTYTLTRLKSFCEYRELKNGQFKD